MENVMMKVEGNTLTITVDLSKEFGRSKKGMGKNTIIATSSGIQPVSGATNGAKIGLNVFK